MVAAASCQPTEVADVRVTQDVPYTSTAELDVYARPGGRRLPIVVTLHGCCGTRQDLAALALGLAEEGAVVFNASWRNLLEGGGYPGAYEEVACALRFARARGPAFGGNGERVTVVGWSDGALLAGVVANAGDDFAGDCLVEGETSLPDAFVAVGGFLGWPDGDVGRVDPGYVNDGTVRYFGGRPDEVPEAWAAGNPFEHLGKNRRLDVRLVVGTADPLVADNRCFHQAALRSGHRSHLVIVEGAGHQTVIAPRLREGEPAVAEILSAATGRAPTPMGSIDLACSARHG